MIFSFRITIAMYFASPASAPTYFGNDFKAAENQMAAYDSLFTDAAAFYKQDTDVLKAIVFPEFLRYSYLSDLMESFALEQIYTEYGSSMADFSIGQCQMKPSFAEDIEKRGINNPSFRSAFTSVNTGNSPAARRERVERMKNIKWQLRYLALFVKIAGDKFRLNNYTKQEKVRMLATIYNRGMNVSLQRLPLLAAQHSFPNGNRAGNSNPYAYADLSILFMKRNAQQP
ncbi:MAG: hypothetical protein ACHQF2_08725 [Flavobacteriales bacterium]